MSDILLQAKNIHKGYKIGKREISVLRGINLEVVKGEWLAVLGASGSGKTTLLNILGALEAPDSGEVLFMGKSYPSMNRAQMSEFRKNSVGFIFQSYHLVPELTVIENVMLPGMIAGRIGAELEKDAQEMLEKAGLGHRTGHKPSELSGGEQQRAAIARSLINSPSMILADEPTGNLDSATGSEILDIFTKLRKINTTIIMVTHDRDVSACADRTVHVVDGKIVD